MPLDQPLITAGQVEAVFLDRVRPLPKATRMALLTCALYDKGDLGLLFRALAAQGLPLQALDPAVEAGLAATRDGAVSFRHPLIRSAVYSAAGPGQRRATHLSLAAALDRAVELTGDDGKRGQWLVRAAMAWSNAGVGDRAAVLYDEALRVSADPSVRARAQGGRAYLAFSQGAGAAARDEFIAEAEAYAAGDPVAAGRLMSLAVNYDTMRYSLRAASQVKRDQEITHCW